MIVKGNHPLSEIIAKCMSGIQSVPKEYQQRMINRACKKAVEWHENKIMETEVKQEPNELLLKIMKQQGIT